MESFGELILIERKKRGLLLKEVAQHILKADRRAISIQYLDNLEKSSRMPSDEIVLQFAQYFSISEDLLFTALGRLPPDILACVSSPEQLLVAFQAFRRALDEASDVGSQAVVLTFVRPRSPITREKQEIPSRRGGAVGERQTAVQSYGAYRPDVKSRSIS